MMARPSRTIGIDVGTSTTLVATREGERVEVVPLGETTSWMPSVIGRFDDGTLVAGDLAEQLPPERTFRSIKGALTRGEALVESQAGTLDVREGIKAILSTAIRRADERRPGLFHDAEVFLGCPALWTGRERRLLVAVAAECGLDVDIAQVIDEPVAAGLHWANSQWELDGGRPRGKTLIFDAGGGTLDVAYLDIAGLDAPEVAVLAAEGVAESGDALDRSIFAHLAAGFSSHIDDPIFRLFLERASRTLKEMLSAQDRAAVPVGSFGFAALAREELETCFASQLTRATRLVQSAVRGSLLRVEQPEPASTIRGYPWCALADEVRHVALVGGLSQVPSVAREIAALFPHCARTSGIRLVERAQESVVRGLTFGDRLYELNLPRPPINFVVEYDPKYQLPPWTLYEAYTPLYAWHQIMVGESDLGRMCPIPVPKDVRETVKLRIYGVAPDRSQTRMRFTVRDHDGRLLDETDSIELEHHPGTRITPSLKLKTNGEVVVNTARRTYSARVTKWPRLRGPHHDYTIEIREPAHDKWQDEGDPNVWLTK